MIKLNHSVALPHLLKMSKPNSESNSVGSVDDTLPIAELKAKESATKVGKFSRIKKIILSSPKASQKRKITKPKTTPKKSAAKKRKIDKTTDRLKHGIPLTEKHCVVHNILRRWNYCFQGEEVLKVVKSGENAKAQNDIVQTGFKGLSVGFRGDLCGKVVDERQITRLTPTLNNLLKLESEELKEYLIIGIKNQLKALVENRNKNPDSVLEKLVKELKKELEKAEKLKPDKIEKAFLKLKYVA
eukprot:maker-scaffold_44-snap-gene-1.99-mRNA-1 protein AED:0.00 eAED:0.00 QI:53/1/1/1/1/1/3/35/242